MPVALAACVLLCACGQKGALLMPDAPRSAVPAATPAPAPVGGEKAQDDSEDATRQRR